MSPRTDALGRPVEALPFWAKVSRPLRVTFPAASTSQDVAHTLGVIPTGLLVLWADATITAVPGKLWTTTLAYLQASAANAHAIICFVVTREEPVNA